MTTDQGQGQKIKVTRLQQQERWSYQLQTWWKFSTWGEKHV